MLRNSVWAVCLVSATLIATCAQSEQADAAHETWGESGDWVIKVDASVGNGCYMERTTEDGTLVQVGIVPDLEGGFFAAYNSAWDGIEAGVKGTVYFDFGASLFGGEYVGSTNGDMVGGYAFFNNPEFIKEFARRNEVVIEGDRGNALDFKLTGTLKAINAVRNCDAEQPKQ